MKTIRNVEGVSRRAVLGAGAATAVTFMLPATARATETVRFASVGGLTDAGLYLADEFGYFNEEGITLEVKRMSNAPALVTALATNQLDVAGIAVTPALFTSAEQGIKLRIVGDKQSYRPGFAATRVVVRSSIAKATPAETAKILPGKTIAVSARASSSFYNAIQILNLHGVDIKQMTVKELAFPAMLAALTSGAIDAAYIIEPYLSRVLHDKIAVEFGNAVEVSGAKGSIAVPLVYSEDFCAKRDVAQSFMNAYIRGVRAYNDAFLHGKDKDKIQEIMARRAGVSIDVIRNTYPAGLDPNQDIDLDSIRDMYKFFLDNKFITAGAHLDKLVDLSFAKAAVQKYGRYQ